MKKLCLLLLCSLAVSASGLCQDEYIEGIGWKKIIYPQEGPPIEMAGKCNEDSEDFFLAAAVVLIGWGIYEIVLDRPEPIEAIYVKNNLQILPLYNIQNLTSSTSANITLFKYSF
ncbi:hypothetical protein M9B39_03070 [SAR86 cluster bacterium]|jgi:hypothetical protein|nr:hypothetical protein M9B39_03070 [SAR86 cluster bacterium]